MFYFDKVDRKYGNGDLVIVIHFHSGADLISVILVQAFLLKLKLYLNFSSGLTDAAACSNSS